jgi:hypothetical protein
LSLVVANELLSNPVLAASDSEKETLIFSREGTSAWSTHFKPDRSIINIVNVPAQWADFFTAKLSTFRRFLMDKDLAAIKNLANSQ